MSDKQIEASRENGAKSHGPITPEGKQKSSQNSLKHGLCSRSVVLPGESEEEFNKQRIYWIRQLQPQTPVERTQVERIAVAAWILDRYPRIEASLLTVEMQEHAADPEALGRTFKELAQNSRALELLNRYHSRARRDYENALKIYRQMTDLRQRQFNRDKQEMHPDDFTSKWGWPFYECNAVNGYCFQHLDRLPNEPEDPGILTAGRPVRDRKPS